MRAFVFALVATGILITSPEAISQTARVGSEGLPVAAKSVLNTRFPGWTLEPRADYCDPPWAGAVKKGDFNADGRTDYLVKVQTPRAGDIIALLAEGTSYKVVFLNASTARLSNLGIKIARWGTYPAGSNHPGPVGRDAAVVGLCESSSATLVYTAGRFVVVDGTD